MKLIVTRAAPQAPAWLARLREAGADAVALPLIGIQASAEPAAVAAEWQQLAAYSLVVFVSPNAVAGFFSARPAALEWPPQTRAAAPGPGTADALRNAGLAPRQVIEPAADSASFDSEALWARLRGEDWAAREVLFVRGDGGREFLADRLREAGARVAQVSAYRRTPPRWSTAERGVLAAALAAPQEHLWHFSSAEAIDHLDAAAPGAGWSAAWALATHPRIAERARRLGIGHVIAGAPGVAAALRTLAETHALLQSRRA